MAHTVVVFSQPGWLFCQRTKEFLRANNVPFTDRDITTDDGALAELEKLGVMTTPVTVIDGQMVIGFEDVPRFKTLLGLWDRLRSFGRLGNRLPPFVLEIAPQLAGEPQSRFPRCPGEFFLNHAEAALAALDGKDWSRKFLAMRAVLEKHRR